MFLLQLFIGAALICLTVVIHAVALDRLMFMNARIGNVIQLRFGRLWKVPMLVISVLGTFMAHIVQIWIWALFYISVGAVHDFESALYFSTSTFTTVGYGDVVLNETWRLVSSFQAANGFILFGWSTAFIFEVMSKLYERETSSLR